MKPIKSLSLVMALIFSVCLISPAISEDIKPALPSIPDKNFKLTDYGANGDGKTLSTDAFVKAIAAVSAAGGGHLEVPAGKFLTLPFALVSKLDLHLDDGATIQFPDNYEAYGLTAPAAATAEQRAKLSKMLSLISGDNLTDVSITGSGTIDGGGSAWWGNPAAKARPYNFGDLRPKLVILSNSRRLLFQGFTASNSPMWHLTPSNCQDLTFEDLTVLAPEHSPNTDAINPNGCSNVLIKHCHLDEGDDNVAIKAISAPCFNILVEDLTCLHGHGISIGSETYKGIHDITVRNCTFNGTANGIRIKSARDRGNQLYNFSFSNIDMQNVPIAITLNMYYMDRNGQANRTEKPATATTPYLKNVTIEHVKAVGASRTTCEIIGLPESPILDVKLNDVNLTGAKDMVVQDAKVTMTDVTVNGVKKSE